jgi:YD repeat-containing protein
VPVTCRRNSSNISSLSIYQSYGDPGRLTGQHVVGAGALDLTYAYDADGNIVNYFDGTNPHTFTYDFAGRLQSWTYQGNTVQYDYDATGNLKNPHGKTLTFNAANEVEGFTYDEAGNLLQDGRYQYTWDGEGRLYRQRLKRQYHRQLHVPSRRLAENENAEWRDVPLPL